MNPSQISEEILSKRVVFLRNVALFAEMGEEDLKVLAKNFHSRKYKKKEIIFHQGDDSHILYVVMKGKVRIFSISPAGNETSIRIFSTHDMLGEFAAIDGQPRSTTAQAVDDCVLLEIGQTEFLQCFREMPELAMGLVKQLVEKLRWTTAYAESMAQYDTAGRLLHILLHYNEVLGKEIDAGKRYELDLSMNQADLASLVGARREWVNRILRDWSKRGLIEYRHGKITILDLVAVELERDRSMELYAGDDEW
ncbi:MAG: Crp/Fnr family transcriptional regulator [Desulfobacteraceae bacterium]|nr:MAG: Crp/Fnr family transcriptional regulator [Desulfobacteraceae bacterium]